MIDPNSAAEAKKPPKQQPSQKNKSSAFVYDLILWTLARSSLANKPPSLTGVVMVDIFFREIRSRGSYRIPRRGAVIFVAAPHANQVFLGLDYLLQQFIDPLILMREARREAGRRISFLIAESSMRRRFVGSIARAISASSPLI